MSLSFNQELNIGLIFRERRGPGLSDAIMSLVAEGMKVKRLYYLLFWIALAFLPSLVGEIIDDLPEVRLVWSIPAPQRVTDFSRRCIIAAIWTKNYIRYFRLAVPR